MAKLQGLIFEEELMSVETCFEVSLKQLLKSLFPEVGICARLSHPKSRCCCPNPSCAQGAQGAGIWSLNTFPTCSTPCVTPARLHWESKMQEPHRDIAQSRSVKLGFSSGGKDEGKRKAVSCLRRCSGCSQVWSWF